MDSPILNDPSILNKSIVITGNVFSNRECSLDDYPDDYRKYPYSSDNQFVFEVDGCTSDDAATFLPLAKQGNARAMFRLGVIATDPCESRKWRRQAADLGHKESIRILETHKDIFKQAGCE